MSLELVASRRRGTAGRTRWIRCAGVLAVIALVCMPFVASAKARHDPTPARSSAAVGAVYGGVTPQEYGVMVEVNRSGRRIVRMATGLALDCATGPDIAIPDGWAGLRVSKSGKFSQSFGPETQRDADGTSVEIEGSVAGRFNKSRTSVSGTWSFKVSFLDAAGAVRDTCDSGTVNWRARQ